MRLAASLALLAVLALAVIAGAGAGALWTDTATTRIIKTDRMVVCE